MRTAFHDFYLRDLKWPVKARVDNIKNWISERGLNKNKLTHFANSRPRLALPI